MTHIKQTRLFKIKTMNLLQVIFIAVFSLMGVSAYADMESYHIQYHKDSKIKNQSLSNTGILIEFHRNGKAIGRLQTTTNHDQNLEIDNPYGNNLVIHILSIIKDGKRIRCWGVSTPNTKTIDIKCDD